ncbi:MAG: hypothetical protein J6R27_01870 [Muribaculaceae bacterium]|nr:hypothetical protein [Muribaculaceae bacterium]
MTVTEIVFLDKFEQRIHEELLQICVSTGALDSPRLLASDDIDEQWHKIAPEYMVDAVPQIKDYPTVSVAWAAYLGMAIACGWDADWEQCREAEYKSYYGEQGFDDMDEHIVRDIIGLPLETTEAQRLEALIRQCGENAVTLIRREGIEPQSPMAFHVFARACRAMFRIGASIELRRLGYKLEKIDLPN